MKPSDFDPALSDKNLTRITDVMLEVRADTEETMSTDLDDRYTLETAFFGRNRNALIQFADSGEIPELKIVHRGMDLLLQLGKTKFRFFKDDFENPAKIGFFKQKTLDLFPEDPLLPVFWRFVIEPSVLPGGEYTILFVGYDVKREPVCVWRRKGVPVLRSLSKQLPDAVELPPAEVSLKVVEDNGQIAVHGG